MDVEKLAKAWRRRLDEEDARLRHQAQEARQTAEAAATALVEEFGAQEVWLFGSLVTEPRHPDFDVDLATLGLRSDQYFRALARASEIVERPVDLVALETAPLTLVRGIRQRGVRIDGR